MPGTSGRPAKSPGLRHGALADMRLSPSWLRVLAAHRSQLSMARGVRTDQRQAQRFPQRPASTRCWGHTDGPRPSAGASWEAAAHSPCPVRKKRGAQSSSQRPQVVAWCRLCPVVPGLSFAFVPSSTRRTQDAPSQLPGPARQCHVQSTRREQVSGEMPQEPEGIAGSSPAEVPRSHSAVSAHSPLLQPHTRQPAASSSSPLCPLSASHPSFPEQGGLPRAQPFLHPKNLSLNTPAGQPSCAANPSPHSRQPTRPPGLPSPENHLLYLDFGLPLARHQQAPDF